MKNSIEKIEKDFETKRNDLKSKMEKRVSMLEKDSDEYQETLDIILDEYYINLNNLEYKEEEEKEDYHDSVYDEVEYFTDKLESFIYDLNQEYDDVVCFNHNRSRSMCAGNFLSQYIEIEGQNYDINLNINIRIANHDNGRSDKGWDYSLEAFMEESENLLKEVKEMIVNAINEYKERS